jgi:MFS family permease
LVYAAAGLLFSLLLVRDTGAHLALERRSHPRPAAPPLSFARIFARVSFTDRSLFAASQAGLVNNLNDGMSWGILPLFFAAHGLGIEQIGLLKAAYPAVWGILQIVTGSLSDRWGRKGLIAGGMWVQAVGLVVTAATGTLHGGCWAASFSESELQWCIRLCSPPSRTRRSLLGGRAGCRSIGSGVTSVMRSERWPPASSPICLGLASRSW